VHEAYGLTLQTASVKNVTASVMTTVSDLLRRGETTPLPLPFVMRYGYKDSPQAVVIVDRAGIVRHVVQAGPNAELPSNAEILRRLDAIR
jgi:hypothetical protein